MSISKALRFRIFQRDNHTCTYCGRRAPTVALEVDHIHPRSLGGPDGVENLTTACYECNRGKRDTPLRRGGYLWHFQKGPLAGHSETTETEFPLFWVTRDGQGVLRVFVDAWRIEEGEATNRPVWGHPAFHPPKKASHDFDAIRAHAESCEVIGAYWRHEYEQTNGTPDVFWATMDQLIVEFTA